MKMFYKSLTIFTVAAFCSTGMKIYGGEMDWTGEKISLSPSGEFRIVYKNDLGDDGNLALRSGDFFRLASMFGNSEDIRDIVPVLNLEKKGSSNGNSWNKIYSRPMADSFPDQIFVSDNGFVTLSCSYFVRDEEVVRLKILGQTGENLVDISMERFFSESEMEILPFTSRGLGVWIKSLNFAEVHNPSDPTTIFNTTLREQLVVFETSESTQISKKRFIVFFSGEVVDVTKN